MKFALVGYDKDNDVYGVIEVHEDLEYLKLKGKDVAEIQKETDGFRVNGNGEPFDWFEIVNADDTEYPNVYYWASYTEDYQSNVKCVKCEHRIWNNDLKEWECKYANIPNREECNEDFEEI